MIKSNNNSLYKLLIEKGITINIPSINQNYNVNQLKSSINSKDIDHPSKKESNYGFEEFNLISKDCDSISEKSFINNQNNIPINNQNTSNNELYSSENSKDIYNPSRIESYNGLKEFNFISKDSGSISDISFINKQNSIIPNRNGKDNKLFNIQHNKTKRGRKTIGNNPNKRPHSGTDYDNILRKIHVYYLNFIVNFINDISCAIFKKKRRKFQLVKFDYNQKRIISSTIFNTIKTSKIEDIIKQFKISLKYNVKETINEDNLKYLSQFESLRNILDNNYLEFFDIFYNDKKPLKCYVLENERIIHLSKKTKSFYFLIEKNKKNEDSFNETLKIAYNICSLYI